MADKCFQNRLGVDGDEWMGFCQPAASRAAFRTSIRYLLAGNFLVPMRAPTGMRAEGLASWSIVNHAGVIPFLPLDDLRVREQAESANAGLKPLP